MAELVMNMKKTMSSQPLQQGNYFNHMKLEEVWLFQIAEMQKGEI